MSLADRSSLPDVGSMRWTPDGPRPAAEFGSGVPPEVQPDPSLDRIASLVRDVLGVPTSLVTIVEPDRQVFPGASGSAMHYGHAGRQSPLANSICRFVVSERAPLFISDLRRHSQLREVTPVRDAGIVAYGGHPLTDHSGQVIGSLCALDIAPREWTSRERSLLADLAAACSSEIALRQLEAVASRAARTALDASHRARTLLSITQKLSTAHTPADVALQIRSIATEQLGCSQAGLWNLHSSRPGTLRYVWVPGVTWDFAQRLSRVPLSRDNPVGRCLLDDEPLFVSDREAGHRMFPDHITAADGSDGSGACFPLSVDGDHLGALVLGWPGHRELTDEDQVLVSALAVAAAGAVHRAWLLDDQAAIATRLQRALLTDLPDVPGMQLAAVYRPARASLDVGGDWYDAMRVDDETVSLTVGDVVGHDLEAAAIMGPVRVTLRAFACTGQQDPAVQVELLDRVMGELYSSPLVSLVHARVHRTGAEWTFEWTNAGHPEPVVLDADGSCRSLTTAPIDCLLGVRAGVQRQAHRTAVAAGSTLLMFTDGLLGYDLDAGRAALVEVLSECGGLSVDDLLHRVVGELVPDTPADDVAILAVRF